MMTGRTGESALDETIVRVVLDVLGDGTEVSLRRVIVPWRTAACRCSMCSPRPLVVDELLAQDVCVPAMLSEFAQHVQVYPA
jgi:hypothetical protein